MRSNGIFSTYSQNENRVTSSIIQVMRNLPIVIVEEFLSFLTQNDTSEFIKFTNQPKAHDSIPDASISSSFSVALEAKVVKNSINAKQLEQHIKWAEEKLVNLVYLTPDRTEPSSLVSRPVRWLSFHELNEFIEGLIADENLVLSERDQFLLRNLQILFDDSNLLPLVDPVLIVPARIAWPYYEEFGVYICQENRSFREVDYLGFYSDGHVQSTIAKVVSRHLSVSIEDVCNGIANLKPSLAARIKLYAEKIGFNEQSNVQVFDLSLKNDSDSVTLNNRVKNDKVSSSGKAVAYTQNQTYTSLENLRTAKFTSEL